jgi:hypothetical protein
MADIELRLKYSEKPHRVRPDGSHHINYGRLNYFDGYVDDVLVVECSHSPFLEACRALVERGCDPLANITSYTPEGKKSLFGVVGKMALRAVSENSASGPRFVKYVEFPTEAFV